MNEPALYPEVVLDHYRNPRNHGALDTCTHAADGANPLCGDRLRIELRCEGGRIRAMRFSGEACAIAIATASMLDDQVAGLDRAAVGLLAERIARLVTTGDAGIALGALDALAPLQRHPVRRKCALLPIATVCAALDGHDLATTEPGPA
jgi:nitrogen fixation protein NifU and related proteins